MARRGDQVLVVQGRTLSRTARLAEDGSGPEEIEVKKRDGTIETRIVYKLRPSLLAKTQALNTARPTVMDAGKMAGVVVEKTEHSGTVANLNIEVSPDQVAELKWALSHARTEV